MLTRVLVDANVLFSRTLRDWLALIELAEGPYKVYWTEDILAEVLYRLRRQNPQWDGAKTVMIRERIVATFEGGRVDDFVVDGSFDGDPHDQHVHAAAIACDAHVLLTADEGFHPRDPDGTAPYEAHRPDSFLVLVDDSAPGAVRRAAQQQVSYYVQRSGEADLCGQLRAAGCPEFAERIRQHLQLLDL